MTSRAIDRACADGLLQILVEPAHERPHLARGLFGFLVVFVPRLGRVAMRAIHAERSTEAGLHHAQHTDGRHAFEQLNVLEDFFSGFVFLPGDLFFESGDKGDEPKKPYGLTRPVDETETKTRTSEGVRPSKRA